MTPAYPLVLSKENKKVWGSKLAGLMHFYWVGFNWLRRGLAWFCDIFRSITGRHLILYLFSFFEVCRSNPTCKYRFFARCGNYSEKVFPSPIPKATFDCHTIWVATFCATTTVPMRGAILFRELLRYIDCRYHVSAELDDIWGLCDILLAIS